MSVGSRPRPLSGARLTRRAALLGGAAALGAALALGGCGRRRLRDEAPDALVIAANDEPRQLDPHLASTLAERRLAWLLFTPLVGTPERPGLAVGWERLTADRWRFALDPAARLDANALSPAAVVQWNVERLQRLRAAGQLGGAAAGLPIAAEVGAPDAVDLLFDPTAAVSAELLAGFYLVPPSYYATTPTQVLARGPRGSGPYRLESWTRERLILRRAGAPGPAGAAERLLWLTDPTASRRVAMVAEGDADVAPDLGLQDLYRAAAADLTLVQTEDAGNVHAQFDARIGLLADARVRRALNLAVDRRRIIQQQYEGRARPLAGICNGPWENRALAPYDYDPARARALLEEAGVTVRDGVAYQGEYPWSLPILSTSEYEPAARAIARDFERLGITTVVTSLSPVALDGARRRPSPFGLIVGYLGGSASGIGELRWVDPRFRSDLAPGALAADPGFQGRLDALAAAPSREALHAQVAALQADVLEAAPWLFLFRLPRYTACRPQVGEVALAPTGELLLA